jgi:hypothetical protein
VIRWGFSFALIQGAGIFVEPTLAINSPSYQTALY